MYGVDDGGQEPTEPSNLILNLTGDLQEPPKMPTLVEVAEAQKTDKFCRTVAMHRELECVAPEFPGSVV